MSRPKNPKNELDNLCKVWHSVGVSEFQTPTRKGESEAQMATTTITPQAAQEPGALDGFAIRCSECGPIGGSSLRTLAEEWAREHRAWHQATRPTNCHQSFGHDGLMTADAPFVCGRCGGDRRRASTQLAVAEDLDLPTDDMLVNWREANEYLNEGVDG